jgi:hypothetical protein
VPRTRGDTTFDSWHGSPLCVRKHVPDTGMIRTMNRGGTAQMTLPFGRLLRQDVPQVGLRAFETTATKRFKTLGRAALGFELGHAKKLLVLA